HALLHSLRSFPTRRSSDLPEVPVLGEGGIFYSPEEVIIGINEGKVSKHAHIKCRVEVRNDDGTLETKLIDTVAGRILFNQAVPKEVGFINELLTKKKLQQIIGQVFKLAGGAR